MVVISQQSSHAPKRRQRVPNMRHYVPKVRHFVPVLGREFTCINTHAGVAEWLRLGLFWV
jgi:hypothetical protein